MAGFRLDIDLGNDAMQTPADIAAALRQVADRLEQSPPSDGTGSVKDANGNTVGGFSMDR